MNAKAKQSSTSNKEKLVLFSIVIIVILIVVLSNTKKQVQVNDILPSNGPTQPANVQGPSGPPPA